MVIYKTIIAILIAGVVSTVQAGQTLVIEESGSKLIELTEPIKEVFVADPAIADVQVSGGTNINILGKKPGTTTVVVTNHQYIPISKVTVQVRHNLTELTKTTQKIFPEENIQFDSTPSSIIVKGEASSPAVAQQIESIAADFAHKGQSVKNLASVNTSTQVLLKVKVAEVQRSLLNSFAINWSALINNAHGLSYGILNGRDAYSAGFTRAGSVGEAVPGSYGIHHNDGSRGSYTALLDALNSEGLGTVLAEPNLITTSGETASFLVGGEFPYPVPQNQNVTIEFKKFGISLSFTPTVLSADQIFLKVRPEVSELDKENTLSFLVAENRTVELPAIKTSVVETAVELGSGQSLAIAGLLSSTLANNYADLPGLADIPVLGTLFRSTRFQRRQTELVVIVTPHIITPTSEPNALKLPTDKLRAASALESLLYKRLNRPGVGADNDNMIEADRLYGAAGFNVEG
ncbi:MAG: type II and III secretion system protein family protein [Candidatus Paracaedibacteraceae bacterium]|nr:type II and III secretion system protein family protein [Candidatus Paracaedibacteraceae bacterium]